MEIPEDILQLHEDLIEFGSRIQTESARGMEINRHINENIYIVFYKINAYAVTLHRAVKSLSEAGWAHISPILLRTILECMAYCLAIMNNKHPEYMAFKYLYHPYIVSLRDNKSPENLKEEAKREIKQGIEKISSEEEKEKAKIFVSEKNPSIYWFKPEESGISSIINKYAGEDSKFIYKILSTAVHAGHFGLFLFRDDSDVIDINPSDNPKKANIAIMMTCRYLLELLNIRNVSEGLGFDSEYNKFLRRILSFENKVRY